MGFGATSVLGLALLAAGCAMKFNWWLVGGGTAVVVLSIIWGREAEQHGKKGKGSEDEDGKGA